MSHVCFFPNMASPIFRSCLTRNKRANFWAHSYSKKDGSYIHPLINQISQVINDSQRMKLGKL